MTEAGYIAVMPVILPIASDPIRGETSVIDDQPMLTLDQFQRELSYRTALSAARRLQTEEIITRREFVRIDAFLRRKFSPVWGGLYPDNG